MFSINDYGAKGDGATLNTVAIQKAVDACSKAGGGSVIIPCGRYVSGTIELRSNVCVHLEDGAVLLGSTDLDNDFRPDETMAYQKFQDTSHSFFHHSLFFGEHLENVSFTGNGTIDMQSVWEKDFTRSEYRRGAKPVALKECKNVLVESITIKGATDLALYFAGCETVRVAHVVIDCHIDGISPDSCKDVVITNCIVRSGDDGIVPKSSYTLGKLKFMENLVISNCVVSSRCNAIKLGTESNTGYRNVSISNCTIYNTRYAGIALEIVDGGLIEGVSISNITMRNVGTPFFIIIGDRRRGPEGTDIGEIRNVIIDNVVATGTYESWAAIHNSKVEPNGPIQEPEIITSTITGLPGHPVKNLMISNVRLVVQGGGTKEDAAREVPELPKTYAESNKFGKWPPAYAMWFRHVEDLSLHNISVGYESPDLRPAFGFVDAHELHLENLRASKEPDGLPSIVGAD